VSKQLLILRHAKSSWSDEGIADHERKLNKRGKRDAPRMGEFLAARNLIPDIILTSTARRARDTAQLFAENCAGFKGEIKPLAELYLAREDDYFDPLRQLPSHIDVAMVVGHNPGLESLVELLGGHYHAMPTAAVAHFRLAISDWSELGEGQHGELVSLWRPKEIDDN
jgi:phosphohistidine phosphatase